MDRLPSVEIGNRVIFTSKDDYWITKLHNVEGKVVGTERIGTGIILKVKVPVFREPVLVLPSEFEEGYVILRKSRKWKQKI